MRHGSLFSGIGGFDLAAQRVGFENIFQVEIDKFCQKVLTKNFPNVKKYLDIKDFDGTEYRGEVDIISGGFPCQPFSHAGKRKGDKDERALFPEMLRVVREAKPKWIVAENVGGILSINDGKYFEEICSSLEDQGYSVQPFIIPACAVNAPHKRDRVWIIAHSVKDTEQLRNGRGNNGDQTGSKCTLQIERPNSELKQNDATYTDRNDQRNNGREIQSSAKKNEGKMEGKNGQRLRSGISATNNYDANPSSSRCKSELCKPGERETGNSWERSWYEVATRFCRIPDGLSSELYELETSNRVDRLKGLGNAIVPQIAQIIFEAIKQYEEKK